MYLVPNSVAATGVCDPYIIRNVHEDTMWPDEHAGGKAFQQITVVIEKQDRWNFLTAVAGVLPTSFGNPDVSTAVLSGEYGACRSPSPLPREFAPDTFNCYERIWRVVLS